MSSNISLLEILNFLGRPSANFLPVVSIDRSSVNGKALPIVCLIFSAVGSEIGSNLTKKDGVELLIETDAGRLISIIQEASSINYSVNQRVRIIKRNGKSRVLPFN